MSDDAIDTASGDEVPPEAPAASPEEPSSPFDAPEMEFITAWDDPPDIELLTTDGLDRLDLSEDAP